MKFSCPVDFHLPTQELYDIYWNEFGHKLDDRTLYKDDNRIMPVVTGFLITGKDIKWPVQSLLDALDIELQTARLFVTNPHRKLQIHKDCLGQSKELRPWAINIPIANCDLGINEWFEDHNNDFGTEQFAPGGSAIMPEYFDNNYIVSESMVLNSIQLIKTDVFHRSNNTGNDNRRVVLSLRGKPDVTWADILEKVNVYNRRRAEDNS